MWPEYMEAQTDFCHTPLREATEKQLPGNHGREPKKNIDN